MTGSHPHSAEGSPRRLWLSENAKWIIAALLIPFVTWIYGLSQQRLARDEQSHEMAINDARNDVTALTALLPALTDSDHTRASIALAILTRLKSAQHNPQSPSTQVFDAIEAQIRSRTSSADPVERSQASLSAETISQANGERPVLRPVQLSPAPAATSSAAEQVRPTRVFLQIWSEDQRAAANRLRDAFRAEGVPVPGIENVAARVAGSARQPAGQIRYFNAGDLAGAQWAVTHANTATGERWTLLSAHTSAHVPDGQIEIWWPRPEAATPASGTP